jgi:hypothetical protein
MTARSAVKSAKFAGDQAAEAAAHRAVDVAKNKLGERDPVWWTESACESLAWQAAKACRGRRNAARPAMECLRPAIR